MIPLNDLIAQECRRKAIKDFINSNRKLYFDMIEYARKKLGIFLGPDFMKTCKAEEIMNEIFGDLIDGTRTWDMHNLKLEQIMWRCIDSEVSNLAKKEKRYVSVDNLRNSDDEDCNPKIDILINTEPDDIEGSIDADNLENYCRDVILAGDIDAQIILNEMIKDHKPKMISLDLGISESEAETAVRKIRRRISRNIPYHLIQNLPKDLIEKIQNFK